MTLLRRICVALCLPVVLYLLVALIGALVPGSKAAAPGVADQTILLAAGPIHYDILLPLDPPTREAFGFLVESGQPVTHSDARWLAVGWGSEAFYTATGDYTDLDVGVIWQAVTGDTSVLRFEVLGDVVVGGKIRAVSVTGDQLARLRGQVLQELARDDIGALLWREGVQLSGRDVFYRARSGFSIFRTCNVWVGEVLRDIGVPMGRWTPTPFAVTLSLKLHG